MANQHTTGWPVVYPRPPMPDLSGGSCVTGAHRHPGADWTGTDPGARDLARHVCRAHCPVLDRCRAWALAGGVAYADRAVVGGMTVSERERARSRDGDQPADQLTDQQATSQPVTSQPAGQPASRPASQPASQPAGQPAGHDSTPRGSRCPGGVIARLRDQAAP